MSASMGDLSMSFRFKISVRLAIARAGVAAALIMGCVSDQVGDRAIPTAASPALAVASDTLFTDGFESGGIAWDDNFRPEAKTVVAAAARSGSRGLRATFQAGLDAGSLTKFFPAGDRVYVSAAVRFPSGWTGATALGTLRGSASNPWASFGTGGNCPNGQSWAMSGFTTTAPNLDLSFNSYYVGMPNTGGRCTPVTGAGVATYSPPLNIGKGD